MNISRSSLPILKTLGNSTQSLLKRIRGQLNETLHSNFDSLAPEGDDLLDSYDMKWNTLARVWRSDAIHPKTKGSLKAMRIDASCYNWENNLHFLAEQNLLGGQFTQSTTPEYYSYQEANDFLLKALKESLNTLKKVDGLHNLRSPIGKIYTQLIKYPDSIVQREKINFHTFISRLIAGFGKSSQGDTIARSCIESVMYHIPKGVRKIKRMDSIHPREIHQFRTEHPHLHLYKGRLEFYGGKTIEGYFFIENISRMEERQGIFKKNPYAQSKIRNIYGRIGDAALFGGSIKTSTLH